MSPTIDHPEEDAIVRGASLWRELDAAEFFTSTCAYEERCGAGPRATITAAEAIDHLLELGVIQVRRRHENLRAELSRRSRFDQLAFRWKRDTAHLSRIDQIVLHPAYQQVIGMGHEAIPLILRELDRDRDYWFWALRAITGFDPVPKGQRVSVKEVADAWLAWGREHGYQW